MKFIHFADSHIGAWSSVPELQELGILSLEKVCKEAVSQKVDFVIIAGDLFDSPFVSFGLVGRALDALMKLKSANIPIYLIYGSHDVSTLGESILDLLEKAGIVINVGKYKNEDKKPIFTKDIKTGANIIGIEGRRRGLDKFLFNKDLKPQIGYSIFVFHNLISEILGQDFPFIDGITLDQLPRGFNYYAGGHIHTTKIVDYSDKGFGVIVYPGPLFPANIDELSKLKSGSYVLVDTSKNENQVELHKIKLKDVLKIKIKVEQEIEPQVLKYVDDIRDKIVILALNGKASGKKIEIVEYINFIKNFEPYCVLIDNKVVDSDEIKVDYQQSGEKIEEIENKVVQEVEKDKIHQQVCNSFGFDQTKILKTLMNELSIEKQDDETNAAFEARIINTFKALINNKDNGSLDLDKVQKIN